MLEECQRGGSRTNISEMHHELVDLTPAIQQRVQDTLKYGLRFVDDKVETAYHTSNWFKEANCPRVCQIPFFPLDKNLTQQEIEDINLHFLGYVPFENTVIQTYTTLMVNEILRTITHEIDKGADKVIVHFAPADTVYYANKVALPLYGFISGNTLQMETSFFVEVLKTDFSVDIDQGSM